MSENYKKKIKRKWRPQMSTFSPQLKYIQFTEKERNQKQFTFKKMEITKFRLQTD